MIQTFALATLVLVAVWSIRYGHCRSTCTRGNLTKDIPRVPGYDPKANGVGTTGGMVESLPWEEIVCHPFQSLLDLLQTGEDADAIARAIARARAASHRVDVDGKDPDPHPDPSQPVRWGMTLAMENATILPEWIEVLSNELFGDEGSGTTTTTTTTALSAMLKSQQQKMALKILPPPPSSSSSSSTDDSFFDPNQLASKLGSVIEEAPLDRPSLVLYIPSHVLPNRYPVWKSFRTTPTTTMAMTMTITVLMPSLRPSGDEAAATTTDLRSLVEDWMARSIQQQQQKQKHQKQKQEQERENQGLPLPGTRAVRLTRIFPMEHTAAILMPLLFPLFMPFFVSSIKEIKRYKKLTTTTTRACSSDKPTQN